MSIAVRKGVFEVLFDAASMRRWNDQIRSVDFRELDKQAHKMVVAYVLGKFEESMRPGFPWMELIEGGVFEFIQRTTITDLRPELWREIESEEQTYRELNDWILRTRREHIRCLGTEFRGRFRSYLASLANGQASLAQQVLRAAHLYPTRWEFDILRRANPDGFDVRDINRRIDQRVQECSSLESYNRLMEEPKVRDFIDLCAQLRFQLRWGGMHMVPQISVLGHMLMVAILAYLFSLQIGACERRRYNNFFTGLFHDLPEALTRDIVSPVKKSSPQMEQLVKHFEEKQMPKVYDLLPQEWTKEIRLFTREEFSNKVCTDGEEWTTVRGHRIPKKYNRDEFSPRDGVLIKAIDNLAAYSEVVKAEENGVRHGQLDSAKAKIKHDLDARSDACGIDFATLCRDLG
ncbi:MAG: HD domain-containing protein [bacterium]